MSLIDDIKKSEGFRSKVYRCTGKTTSDNRDGSSGYDTIGYGFAIKDLVLTEEEASYLLANRVAQNIFNYPKV